MKTIFLCFFMLFSTANQKVQETETVVATFNGYEDGVFFFTDDNGYSIEFQNLSPEARQQFDLTDDGLIGFLFEVTFNRDTELDEMEDEVVVNNIVGLLQLQ